MSNSSADCPAPTCLGNRDLCLSPKPVTENLKTASPAGELIGQTAELPLLPGGADNAARPVGRLLEESAIARPDSSTEYDPELSKVTACTPTGVLEKLMQAQVINTDESPKRDDSCTSMASSSSSLQPVQMSKKNMPRPTVIPENAIFGALDQILQGEFGNMNRTEEQNLNVAQQERDAVEHYEAFHELEPGTATLATVAMSDIGISGWASRAVEKKSSWVRAGGSGKAGLTWAQGHCSFEARGQAVISDLSASSVSWKVAEDSSQRTIGLAIGKDGNAKSHFTLMVGDNNEIFLGTGSGIPGSVTLNLESCGSTLVGDLITLLHTGSGVKWMKNATVLKCEAFKLQPHESLYAHASIGPNADGVMSDLHYTGKLTDELFEVSDVRNSNKRTSAQVQDNLEQSSTACISMIIQSKVFVMFFMTLTMYALFVPDLDLLMGDNETKFTLSIVTSAVCILFVIELVLQSIGKPNFFGRSYFWLDVVALVSLLPDTWFMQEMLARNNAFVAGRSSRLLRFIRVAARSSKATRLNRITRIIRVASLMPRLGIFMSGRTQNQDIDSMLDKKLKRVFMYLDEDMDGQLPRRIASACLAKMRDGRQTTETEKESKSMVGRLSRMTTATFGSKKKSLASVSAPSSEKKPSPPPSPRQQASPPPPPEDDEDGDVLPSLPGAMSADQASFSFANIQKSISVVSAQAPRLKEQGSMGLIPQQSAMSSTASGVTSSPSVSANSANFNKRNSTMSAAGKKLRGMSMALVNISKGKGIRCADDEEEDLYSAMEDDLIDFNAFRDMMLSDSAISGRLRRTCQQKMEQSYSTKNVTSRHGEFVAVKVALAVLVLLFVLGFVEPDTIDSSADRGLGHLTELVKLEGTNYTAGSMFPSFIYDQIRLWAKGAGDDPAKLGLMYLDLGKSVYCNDFIKDGPRCAASAPNAIWSVRRSIDIINHDVENSDCRLVDLLPIRFPDLSTKYDLSDDEMSALTESVAVLNIRGEVQLSAVFSIMTTCFVIVVILLGITHLTKDLSRLTKTLLTPLRELADDMESVAQLQLAGVAESADAEEGATNEIRLIRSTFENMKTAVKSWGKYVPWPVVQLLLRANVDAELGVKEVEVSIFFSDIASFTTIVENMAPEASLLLLSRYFGDMSRVIDDHGGVVLEFIGDAILCIYGSPLASPEHPQNAVKAALRMLACLKKMNEWSAQKEWPAVAVRCGVHTGNVLVGNMGFPTRLKYGIIGEDSIIPGKLEEINKKYVTNLLISQATWSRLDTTEMFITRPVDFLILRPSDSHSEPIYQVLGRERISQKSSRYWYPTALHTQAMEFYRNRNFETAYETFLTVDQTMSEMNGFTEGSGTDGPALLMMKRCQSYMQKPPPEDWDGVCDRD